MIEYPKLCGGRTQNSKGKNLSARSQRIGKVWDDEEKRDRKIRRMRFRTDRVRIQKKICRQLQNKVL